MWSKFWKLQVITRKLQNTLISFVTFQFSSCWNKAALNYSFIGGLITLLYVLFVSFQKCTIYHPYTNYIWYELRAMALPFRISMIFKFAFETPVIFIIINLISLSPKVWSSTNKPYLYPQLTQLIWEEYKNMGVDKINYWKFVIVKCSLEKLFQNIVKWPFELRFLTFLRRNIFI